MLYYPNLDIIPADREIILSAIQVIREYNLAPRDAIHAATALAGKVDCIVSSRPPFRKSKRAKMEKPLTKILMKENISIYSYSKKQNSKKTRLVLLLRLCRSYIG